MKTDPALKDFVMLIGVPGSGKTTYGLATFPDHVYLNTDSLIASVSHNTEKEYSEVFDALVYAAVDMVEAQLEMASYSEEDIVLDQTNLTKAIRARRLNLLYNKDKYHKIAIYFDTPEELATLRLTKRAQSGIVIPQDFVEFSKSAIEPPSLDEGFDQIVIIKP